MNRRTANRITEKAVGYYVGGVSDQVTTELIKEYTRNQKLKDEKLKQKPEYVRASFSEFMEKRKRAQEHEAVKGGFMPELTIVVSSGIK
jgi:hypothetical protein